jgi:hypothetical protein
MKTLWALSRHIIIYDWSEDTSFQNSGGESKSIEQEL